MCMLWAPLAGSARLATSAASAAGPPMAAPPSRTPFTSRDLAQLAARGIAPDEALRQLEQLRRPPPALELDRPCTPGDGIERLDGAERARLAALHEAAAARGELCAFV